MYKRFQMHLLVLRTLFVLLAGLMCRDMAPAVSGQVAMNSAASLRAKYIELVPLLNDNQFKRPLYLESTELSSQPKGSIYALVDYPFASVKEAFIVPDHWCDVLILHLNTKYCHAMTNKASSVLVVNIGSKEFQPLDPSYRVEFSYLVAAATPEYFDFSLSAKTGPLGTTDYRIQLEGVSIQNGKTLLHLTYSCAYSLLGKLAMQVYLTTVGRGRVGFTLADKQSSGPPNYIGGMRGVVERNTMRYYLAIDAYLSALSLPPARQFEKRLQSWFMFTELYSRQLHEVDRATYLDMKRSEYLRQQTVQ